MNTSLRRLLTSLLLILGGLTLVSPARAGDAVIGYQLPSADTTGMTAQIAPGVAGCTGGCGSLKLAAGVAVPARRQGLLAFSAPAGTTIVNAVIRLRYRTKQPTVSAHVQSRIGGRWLDGQRLRSVGGTTTTVNAGRGATAVAVTLTADGAVPARVVRSDAENTVAVSSVQLTVRDLSAPTVAWTAGDPASGGWQRGTLCGAFTAHDTGLGVDHVEFAIGSVQGSTVAAGGTRLQPRPLDFDGGVCVDTTQVGDGAFGTTLTAVDGGASGNRSAPLTGLVRIDNTAPVVEYTAPTDPEARVPTAQLAVTDAASGLERVTATVDGLPATVTKAAGIMQVRPATPLADGTHRLAWEAVDVAGNVTAGAELFGVLDVTAPSIDGTEPLGLTTPTAAVVARASDAGSGLAADGWRLAIDGLDVTGAADLGVPGVIAYTPVRPWSEGEHAVRVTVVDASGNRAVRAWTFSIPVTPAPPTPAPVVEATIAPAEAVPTAAEMGSTPVTRPSLELRSSVRRVRVGEQLRLQGRLRGLDSGRVRIEARVGRSWRLVVQVPVQPTGAFATPVRLPTRGAYAVRARVGRLLSNTVQLRAR